MYTNITGKRECSCAHVVYHTKEGRERERKEREEIITACISIPVPTLIVKKSESLENSPQYADAL